MFEKKKKVILLFFSTACPKGFVSSLDIFVNVVYGWIHLLRGFESLDIMESTTSSLGTTEAIWRGQISVA